MKLPLLPIFITASCATASGQYFTKVVSGEIPSTVTDARSCNWIDVNNDGLLDVMVTNGNSAGDNNLLFINQGDWNFTAASGDPVVSDNKPSDGATWADYDNDGDADAFVVNWYNFNNMLYDNNGEGTFTQITTGDPVNDLGFSETASWGDYDNDGNVDLYVSNSAGTRKNFLYHNNGDHTFTKITTGAPVSDNDSTRSVNWVDTDNDGDVDLFVSNEANTDERLYINNGDGTFTSLTGSPLTTDHGNTMSSSWGDIDNDGDMDVFLANDQGNDALFRNDGNNIFTKLSSNITCNSGGNSFGSNFGDIDNDGDLDLFVTNAFWGGPWKNFLFINDGTGTFSRDTLDITTTDTGWSYGNAFGDPDNDGDLDLIVANCYNEGQNIALYENNSNGNHWLEIHCVGVISNRSAIGAKVKVLCRINGELVWQTREISAQTGYCGQNMLTAHFGLKEDIAADSVKVIWPSGIVDVFGVTAADQMITVYEGGMTALPEPNLPPLTLSLSPNPADANLLVQFNLTDATTLSFDISDITGKKLAHIPDSMYASGAQQLQIPLSEYGIAAAGKYLITIRGKNIYSGAIFIIQH